MGKTQLKKKITDIFLGQKTIDAGFTEVMHWLKPGDEGSTSMLKEGEKCRLINVRLDEGRTTPPDYMSESELIGFVYTF